MRERRIGGIDEGLDTDITGLGSQNRADAQGQVVHAGGAFADVREFVGETGVAVNLQKGVGEIYLWQQTIDAIAKFHQTRRLIELVEPC